MELDQFRDGIDAVATGRKPKIYQNQLSFMIPVFPRLTFEIAQAEVVQCIPSRHLTGIHRSRHIGYPRNIRLRRSQWGYRYRWFLWSTRRPSDASRWHGRRRHIDLGTHRPWGTVPGNTLRSNLIIGRRGRIGSLSRPSSMRRSELRRRFGSRVRLLRVSSGEVEGVGPGLDYPIRRVGRRSGILAEPNHHFWYCSSQRRCFPSADLSVLDLGNPLIGLAGLELVMVDQPFLSVSTGRS